jgi:DNA-binding MltR family transcriptional regulator
MARTLADFTSNEKLIPYLSELAGQTDRGCGIVAAAMLETVLERTLRKRFVDGSAGALFVPYGPLSSLSGKIDTCLALGLIVASEHRDLHVIRRIRNDFAHDLHKTSFDDEPMKSQVNGLALGVARLLGTQAKSTRKNFESAFAVLLGFLLQKLQKTATRPTPTDHVPSMTERLRRDDSI